MGRLEGWRKLSDFSSLHIIKKKSKAMLTTIVCNVCVIEQQQEAASGWGFGISVCFYPPAPQELFKCMKKSPFTRGAHSSGTQLSSYVPSSDAR